MHEARSGTGKFQEDSDRTVKALKTESKTRRTQTPGDEEMVIVLSRVVIF
jgi:hypothetical protein